MVQIYTLLRRFENNFVPLQHGCFFVGLQIQDVCYHQRINSRCWGFLAQWWRRPRSLLGVANRWADRSCGWIFGKGNPIFNSWDLEEFVSRYVICSSGPMMNLLTWWQRFKFPAKTTWYVHVRNFFSLVLHHIDVFFFVFVRSFSSLRVLSQHTHTHDTKKSQKTYKIFFHTD